ncbi:MAG: ABC transporter ATP-binding protein [Maledivibacter sp.]|jgi:peptide/nickel transport system ATP-binding protein|nr:ABC transporter ATP-binding protein [Maledivibacter sp.]
MDNILEIKDLVIHYETDDGVVEAVNKLSLKLTEGHTLGIVGETGAGKTTLARGIMGLIPKPPGKVKSGQILYNEKDLLSFNETEMRTVRGKEISMIFQDPMTSLNPVMTVGDQISEVIQNHENLSKKEADKKASEMLELVGIPADRSREYPHQFSGGMKQRVIIAIALACNPNLLIADEPTTALDVTIQAQVLSMMKNLKSKFNMSMVLITHDLGVVAQTCDYVAIMYAGEIVEYGELRDVFKNTQHPYTKGLFGSIPNLVHNVNRLTPIDGFIPDPTNLPKGCSFSTRCKYATDLCRAENPNVSKVSGEHEVRCFINEGKVNAEVK